MKHLTRGDRGPAAAPPAWPPAHRRLPRRRLKRCLRSRQPRQTNRLRHFPPPYAPLSFWHLLTADRAGLQTSHEHSLRKPEIMFLGTEADSRMSLMTEHTDVTSANQAAALPRHIRCSVRRASLLVYSFRTLICLPMASCLESWLAFRNGHISEGFNIPCQSHTRPAAVVEGRQRSAGATRQHTPATSVPWPELCTLYDQACRDPARWSELAANAANPPFQTTPPFL